MRRRFVALGLVVLGALGSGQACGGPQPLGGAGDTCFRAADCKEGLVCISGECSSDLTEIGGNVTGPGEEPGTAGAAGAPSSGGAASGGSASGGAATGGAATGGAASGGSASGGAATGGAASGGAASGGAASGGTASGGSSTGGTGMAGSPP